MIASDTTCKPINAGFQVKQYPCGKSVARAGLAGTTTPMKGSKSRFIWTAFRAMLDGTEIPGPRNRDLQREFPGFMYSHLVRRPKWDDRWSRLASTFFSATAGYHFPPHSALIRGVESACYFCKEPIPLIALRVAMRSIFEMGAYAK